MKTIRKYRIICLKRSEFPAFTQDTFVSDWYATAHLVYWMPNSARKKACGWPYCKRNGKCICPKEEEE